jgi:CHAT domain-containing protein
MAAAYAERRVLMPGRKFHFLLTSILLASLLPVVPAHGATVAPQSLPAAVADEGVDAKLRAAVNEYFEALRNKDWRRLDGIEVQRHGEMTASGSDSHGPIMTFNVSLELTKRLLAPYEIATLSFTIDKVEVKGRQATVRTTVDMRAREPGTGTPVIDFQRVEMVLHLDNFETVWKVNFDQESDPLLAERIKRAGTSAGRKFLFCQENLWGLSSAMESLKSEGVRLLGQKKLKEAFAVFSLAQEVDLHLRERARVSAEIRAKRREAGVEECRASGRQKDLALNLLWAGQDYAELKDYARAEERLGESIKLLEAVGDREDLARAYKEAAAVMIERGEYSRAVESYQSSIDQNMSVAAENKDERQAALSEIDDAAISVAFLYAAQGKYDQTEEFSLRNSKRLEDLGETEEALLMLYVQSVFEMSGGDNRRAAENLEALLPRLEQAGSKIEDRDEVEAAFHMILAMLYAQQNNFIAAARHLEKMRAARIKGEDAVDAAAWGNIMQMMDGMLYGGQGNEDLMMSRMKRTLPEAIDSGLEDLDIPDILQVWSMGQISENIFSQGGDELPRDEFDLAIQCLAFSETLAEEAGDVAHAAYAHQMIAALYANQNNPTQEEEHYLKGLSLLEGAMVPFKDLSVQMRTDNLLLNLGDVYQSQKKYAEAITTYRKILRPDRLRLLRMEDAQVHLHIAESYYSLGDFGEALRAALEAGRAAERGGNADTLKDIYLLTGSVYRALGQPDAARRSYQSAIDEVELARSRIGGSEPSAAQFFEDKLTPYQAMSLLLLSRGDVDGALSYAERSKSKVLLDVLRNGRKSAARLMSAEELKQDDDLRRKLMRLNQQVIRAQAAHADDTEVKRLRGERVEARLDYELFRARLYVNHPELAEQRSGEQDVFKAEDSSRLLTSPDDAALEFMVTDEKTYLFVLTRRDGAGGRRATAPDFERKVYQVDVGAEELKGLVNNFRLRISHPEGVVGRRARELYELLLGPAREQLAGKRALIIIPDGILWNLPFQALMPSEGRYLLEDCAISYAPSLMALKEMKRVREERVRQSVRASGSGRIGPVFSAPSILAVGDPGSCEHGGRCGELPTGAGTFEPLPGAERLAKRLRDLYGTPDSVNYSGGAANEAAIKREAPEHQVIHIGTHGILDNDNPMYSFLLLSPSAKESKGQKADSRGDGAEDGFLEAWELMELRLKAEMIVLSACDTGRGKVRNGEGVIGFSWAALIAGCPTVVVGQWQVDEAGTDRLMYDFHKWWLEDRKSNGANTDVAAALQQSALILLRDRKYAHPYYWAGFSVVGVGH